MLAERIPRPDIDMAPVDAPDLRGPRPLEMPPGNVPVPVETQQLRPEELDLSSRTPTKVNGVSIVDVGKVAVGFLSSIIERQREEARQAKSKEEADAATQRAQLAKTIAEIGQKAVANGVSAAASAAAAAAAQAQPEMKRAGKDLAEAKRQATIAVVNQAKNTAIQVATAAQKRETEQGAIVSPRAPSLGGAVRVITGLVSGLAQSAKDYASAAASSSGAQTPAAVKAMQKALDDAKKAESQASHLTQYFNISDTPRFSLGDTPFKPVVRPAPALTDRMANPYNATASRPESSLASIKRSQTQREIQESMEVDEIYDPRKRKETLKNTGWFGYMPDYEGYRKSKSFPIIKHPRMSTPGPEKKKGPPPPADTTAQSAEPGTEVVFKKEGPFRDPRQPLLSSSSSSSQRPGWVQRGSRWDKMPSVEQHLAHLIQMDRRSADEILTNKRLLNTLEKEAKRRAAAGEPLYTGIFSGKKPPSGRGRIHVPKPVLPYNDVGNDPYLHKSQHNNIIE